jgi:tetratricopeptide (TPR) repeat protein
VAAPVAAFLLALVLGVIGITWQAIRATGAEAATTRALAETRNEKKKTEEALAQSEASRKAETKAKNDTKEALGQSEEARKRAEAVLGFLKNDVLAAARPEGQEGGLGVDVTVRKAVDAAESKIAERFQDQPIVEAEVRHTLGLTYLYLREATLAIRQCERAVKLRQTSLGPDHPDTLQSRHNLAVAYLYAGRTAEAIEMLAATLKLSESKLGPDHPDTLLSRNNLANSYHAAGRIDEAITMYEANLELSESKLGPDHPDTLLSRNNLAASYESLGRWAGAEILRRDALARRRKTIPPASPLLASDLDGLGRNLLKQVKWSGAEPVLRECLAIRAKMVPDDWSRFHAMSRLGEALLGQDRYAEAESLIVPGYEGMKAREAKIPARRKPQLLEAAERVVKLYEWWGKPEPAAAWQRKLGLADLPADVFARP